MSVYLVARTLKSLSLLALAAGVTVAVSDADAVKRRAAVDRLALPGLFGVWCAGYVLAKVTERSLGTPAITLAMLASVTLFVLLERGSEGPWPRAALVGTLAGATVAMHLRDVPSVLYVATAATTALVAAVSARWLPPLVPVPPDRGATMRRFRALAVFETVTTGALFLVDMPARHGFGMYLDGGLGLFGWVHGAAVLGYVTFTVVHHRSLGGSALTAALRVMAGVVPFAALWVLHGTARGASAEDAHG